MAKVELRPHGIGRFLGHVSVPTQGRACSVSILRDLRKGGFERRHRETLEIFGQHLSRAMDVLTKVAQRQQVQSSMAVVIDRIEAGVILLNERGLVVSVSAAAERFFGQAITVRHGEVRCATPLAQRALDRLVASVLPGSQRLPQGGIALPREDGRSPIFVQAIPIKTSTTERIEAVLLGRAIAFQNSAMRLDM